MLGAVHGQRELRYTCYSETDEAVEGVRVEAMQAFSSVEFESRKPSLILQVHPWHAKGADYISLTREEKADILSHNICKDDTPNDFVSSLEFFNIDVDTVFDERGDEIECRKKTVHSQGNIGRAEWVSVGDHDYTGVFEGGDTGFVRLSSSIGVDRNPLTEAVMLPAISLKFLRDGIASANALANHSPGGQTNYNFFDGSLHSNLVEELEGFVTPANLVPFVDTIAEGSGFIATLGHSDFASFR